MDPSRLHPQARAALGVQQRVPLTMDNLSEVRRSMRDATLAEVGAGPRLRAVTDVDAGGVPARLYRDGADRPVNAGLAGAGQWSCCPGLSASPIFIAAGDRPGQPNPASSTAGAVGVVAPPSSRAAQCGQLPT